MVFDTAWDDLVIVKTICKMILGDGYIPIYI